jgi:tetratricopeptide (TPR) repeat protein
MIEMKLNEPWAYSRLAYVYETMERYEDAVSARKKAMTLSGAPLESIAALDSAYSESGPEGYWMWRLERMKGQYDRYPTNTARYYAQLGDKDQAFVWLEKAHEKHDGRMFTLKVHPFWDPLRDDPRFQDLLRRMNFPEYETQK